MSKTRTCAVLFALLMPLCLCRAQNVQEVKPAVSANETTTILTPDIGGIKQVIQIRTDDATKPVLLFLSGGPGSSMMNGADGFTNILKSRFTIVQWDQRDAGKTLTLNPSPVTA